MRAVRVCLAVTLALGIAHPAPVRAQHPGHGEPMEPPEELPPPPKGPPLPPPEWPRPPLPPRDAVSRDEAREASGTAWQPLSTPTWAVHLPLGPGQLMLHGNAFAAYTDQSTRRGIHTAFSTSWFMGMARLPVGGGSVAARVMASLEPFTVTDGGYPDLFQSGEVYHGQPLHDRQHPHDLFMELALLARVPLADAVGVQVYAAPVGEPALGPVAFPHRSSALHDPIAPLSHHWMDSTHISYGVLTGALLLRDVKIEGSWFNGREPDEHRTDFDPVRFDSWAARVSFAPLPSFVLQASYGRLSSPESLQPEESVHRVTASALWSDRLGRQGHGALTLAWGRNLEGGRAEDALLAECTWSRDGRNAIFARFEWVVKNARELVVPGADPDRSFDVLGLSAGFAHSFGPFARLMPALGVRASVYEVPSSLQTAYGSQTPVGIVVFAQLYPAMATGAGHGAAQGVHGQHGGSPDHGGHE
jgi:hypothetical protein